jgi:hypothetical protein
MIYQHVIDYDLDRPIVRISDFRPAFDDSVVLLASTKGRFEDSLYHFDRRGKLIKEYCLRDIILGFCMPNDYWAMTALPNQNRILLIDLQRGKSTLLSHYFLAKPSCQI